jgi:hypothetical protein
MVAYIQAGTNTTIPRRNGAAVSNRVTVPNPIANSHRPAMNAADDTTARAMALKRLGLRARGRRMKS